jgi:acetylornithine deacetylase/succinyl-diaminopimelate desuccinylase-like protein
MSEVKSYIDNNQQRFLEELLEFLRIPSVSADSKFKQDVLKGASFLEEALNNAGVDTVEVCPTAGHPIVYAEKFISDEVPTILIYGHYDVQPADPYELWESPPFEPVIKNERIYARGSCDDKGQLYMHIKALEILNQQGIPPCNLKFILEGEEEVGSLSLDKFVRDNAERLKSDVVLISDTAIIANDTPSITVGLRGLSYVQVEVTGPNRDLHSGVYGGAVANPINVLCDMISSLIDDNGRITIPGFYDKVVELSSEERAQMASAPFNLEDYKSEIGVAEVQGETGYSTMERIGIRPTLDVNGIWGGYVGEGAKTVLPSKAFAKISMRLVPNQDDQEITRLFTEYFSSLAPESVTVQVTPHHGGKPAVTPTDSVAYRAASEAFEQAWDKVPIPTRDGGSIPIVALFDEVLKTNTVLMGFGLDSDAIHSPNESYGIFNYLKGIETIVLFHHHFAALSK